MSDALKIRETFNDTKHMDSDHYGDLELTGVHKLNADAKDPLRRAAQTAAMRGFIKRDAPSQKAHKLVAADAKTPCSEEELKKFARPCMFDDDLIYRMLLSRNGDFASASKRWYKLAQVLNDAEIEDFNEFSPTVRKVAETLPCWYVHEKPDKHGHPVMNVFVEGVDWGKVTPAEMKHGAIFFMMKAIRQNEYYGSVSGITFVFAMKNWKFSHINPEFEKFIINAFQAALPCKFSAMFPTNGGKLFRFVLWPLFSTFMSAKMASRMHVPTESANEKKGLKAYHELHEWMHESQLQAEHGGTFVYSQAEFLQRIEREEQERLAALQQPNAATETAEEKHADPMAGVVAEAEEKRK